jgi:hypothetical protein
MRDVTVTVRHHEGLSGWAVATVAIALAVAWAVAARHHRPWGPWSSR